MTERLLLHPFTFHVNARQSDVILESNEATKAFFIALSEAIWLKLLVRIETIIWQ